MRSFAVLLAALLVMLLGSHTAAVPALQVSVGSDGSDGFFNPTTSVEIDLGLAVTGTWTDPSTSAGSVHTWGNGIYDPDLWAIVFKFSAIEVPEFVNVTFKNHPARAPVVFLVDTTATISGTLDLSASNAQQVVIGFVEPGPGGFRGGIGSQAANGPSSGFGIGGGFRGPANAPGSGGSYSTPGFGSQIGELYGSPAGLPLIGGSGGGCRLTSSSTGSTAGSGGGALLLAADESILVTPSGRIRANGAFAGGGVGEGSGGLIRLVSDSVTLESGSQVTAVGTAVGGSNARSGDGRVRIEANTATMTAVPSPAPSMALPQPIFPSAPPRLSVTSVESASVPSDPRANFFGPNADVQLATGGTASVTVQGENLPAGTMCQVRVTPTNGRAGGGAFYPTAGPVPISGNQSVVIDVELADGVAAIQAHAVFP